MKKKLEILHLEDNDLDAEIIKNILQEEGMECSITRASNQKEYFSAMHQNDYDIILSDNALPDYDGISALKYAREHKPYTPFIYVSGTIGEGRAVEALRYGARDYVLKQHLNKLVPTIQRIIHESEINLARIQAEQMLRHSYDLLNLTGQMAKVGGWELDIETQALRWTEEVYRIHEIDPATRLNVAEAINFYAPEARPVISNAVQAAIEKGTPWDLELPLITAQGRHIWVRALGASDRLGGKSVRLYGAFQDITERKRSEKAMREHAEQYRTMVSATLFGFWLVDEKGKLLDVNDTYCSMSGYTSEELLNLSVSDLEIVENPEDTARHIQKVIETGTDQFESKHKAKDGRAFDVEISTGFLYSPKQLIVFIRDITDRKRAEQELIIAKEKAESANKLKDAFINNMSHEIRTPLNGILGMSGLIKENYSQYMVEEDESLFTGIDSSAQRIIRTVDMILNYSRLQTGEFSVIPKEIDILEICERMINQNKEAAEKKNLELIFDNRCEGVKIIGDEYSITQVVSNLVDNAVKYTQKGFVSVSLLNGSNDELILEIKDSGIGISDEYLEHLFEPYRQEEMGYGRSYEGIGLGLSLAKKFLDLNNARISVASKKGDGTTFTVTFTKAMKSKKETAVLEKIKNKVEPMAGKQDRLVLIVEDDFINQITTKRLLRSRYSVLITDSYDEAIDILKKNKVDIILMDISISGSKNGLELTKELKASKEYHHIPIIAVTAHAFNADRQNALEAGCDDYLSKPFTKESLLEMVMKFV